MGLLCMGVCMLVLCMCVFFNVCLWVCVDFVMCGCVYV